MSPDAHRSALQRLVNGEEVQYQKTLLVVRADVPRQLNEVQHHSRRSPV